LELKSSIENIQGMAVDEEIGEIAIDVYMDQKNAEKTRELEKIGEKILEVPVRINTLTARMKTLGIVRGGVPLGSIGCTTGFTVKHSSTSIKGITSAGHCEDGTIVLTDRIYRGAKIYAS